jgi:3-hydroxyisobutyrate dehydrogenase
MGVSSADTASLFSNSGKSTETDRERHADNDIGKTGSAGIPPRRRRLDHGFDHASRQLVPGECVMTIPTQRIAVLGTGTMGAPMARRLLHAGFGVRVWNRSPAKAAELVADGARTAATPADAVTGADVVITMLTDGAAVKQVMTLPSGAFSRLPAGSIWVQMSTIGVEWSDRLAELSTQRGITFVDAPVSGSSRPAELGTLEILASGAGQVRPRVEPIFDALGRRTLWLDRAGDGSRLKLALNNWLAILVEGMAETLSLSEALGLDPHLFPQALRDGPMASDYAIAKAAAMLDAAFVPGFPLRHATKDAELALSAAHRHGLELPMTSALLPRWHQAIAEDHGDDDVASAITASAQSVGAT